MEKKDCKHDFSNVTGWCRKHCGTHLKDGEQNGSHGKYGI